MNEEKTILALDTALGNSIALMTGKKIHYPDPLPTDEIKKSSVIILIDSLLQKHSIKIEDLTAIGVNTGPGSFTGIRVSIALVKGFARPYDIPVVPVNSFQAISQMIGLGKKHTIIINAGGGFVYLQDYGNIENHNTPIPARLMNIDSLAKNLIQESVILYGSGLDKVPEKLRSFYPECKIIKSDSSIINSIIHITHEAVLRGNLIKYRELKPCYIKPSYADLI